jgi:hypothetical protein
MRSYPGELSPIELVDFRSAVCKCWSITEKELDDALAQTNGGEIIEGKSLRFSAVDMARAVADENELDLLLPKHGYFRDYVEYTRESESPLAYHFYVAVVGLAAMVNRRCGFNFGPIGKIYPPLGIMLLGPSGIKKTTAGDVMLGMLTDTAMIPVYAEKVTPESLVEGMKKGQAVGLVYAPEMSVFLGKASYQEGLVPLLTRLMDSPDKWTTTTISRGTTTLVNVALTTLMCSTSDWFINNTPADMFGGGFIARNLLIHQTISPRIIPIPKARDDGKRQEIINTMLDIHVLTGDMNFTPEAEREYIAFYHKNKTEKPEHEMLESYHQRKGTHSIRLAMLLHLATCGDMCICAECYIRALDILTWTEKFLPSLLKAMFRTESGMETESVLRVIRSYNGPIPHSVLVRRMQYKMNARQVKMIAGALKESGDLSEHKDGFSHTYQIKEVVDE